nr:type II toxin-antitoxin system RelE/ParE family toxin [Nitrosomonas sp.]
MPETEDQKLREIIVQGYRVMYRLEVDRILILAIMHGSLGLAEKETKPWEEN